MAKSKQIMKNNDNFINKTSNKGKKSFKAKTKNSQNFQKKNLTGGKPFIKKGKDNFKQSKKPVESDEDVGDSSGIDPEDAAELQHLLASDGIFDKEPIVKTKNESNGVNKNEQNRKSLKRPLPIEEKTKVNGTSKKKIIEFPKNVKVDVVVPPKETTVTSKKSGKGAISAQKIIEKQPVAPSRKESVKKSNQSVKAIPSKPTIKLTFANPSAIFDEQNKRYDEYNSRCVYIRPIPKNCTPQMLKELAHEMVGCRIPIDKKKKSNKGYAFIEFVNASVAEKHINVLSGKLFGGKSIMAAAVSTAFRCNSLDQLDCKSLFVSGLHFYVKNFDLFKIFPKAQLKLVKEDSTCFGSCLANYANEENALAAFQSAHKTIIKGKPICVLFSLKNLNEKHEPTKDEKKSEPTKKAKAVLDDGKKKTVIPIDEPVKIATAVDDKKAQAVKKSTEVEKKNALSIKKQTDSLKKEKVEKSTSSDSDEPIPSLVPVPVTSDSDDDEEDDDDDDDEEEEEVGSIDDFLRRFVKKKKNADNSSEEDDDDSVDEESDDEDDDEETEESDDEEEESDDDDDE